MRQTAWRRTLRRVVSVKLSRRVGKAGAYPPLSDMSAEQRREFHEALLEADASRICLESGRRRRTGTTSWSDSACACSGWPRKPRDIS
jgi:hypothetical protein